MAGLFGVTEGIICQQVNCCGVMGAGLAKAILNQYPAVKNDYDNYYKETACEWKCHYNQFGTYRKIQVDTNLYIANIYSQDYYGNPLKTGKVYTNLSKLIAAIKDIAMSNPDMSIYIPEGIGCGYGGEKWGNVSAHIEQLYLSNLMYLNTRNGQIQKVWNEIEYINSMED